jgi:hypothetical protein
MQDEVFDVTLPRIGRAKEVDKRFEGERYVRLVGEVALGLPE